VFKVFFKFNGPNVFNFRSGSDCDLILFLFLLGRPLQKSARLRRFKSDRDEIGQEYYSSKLHHWRSRIFDLTSHFQDSPWRHFTLKSAAAWWVNTACFPGGYAAAYWQFLMYSTSSYFLHFCCYSSITRHTCPRQSTGVLRVAIIAAVNAGKVCNRRIFTAVAYSTTSSYPQVSSALWQVVSSARDQPATKQQKYDYALQHIDLLTSLLIYLLTFNVSYREFLRVPVLQYECSKLSLFHNSVSVCLPTFSINI